MMRYTRDEILHKGLNLARLPTLDVEERPQGVFHDNSRVIEWLQEVVDKFHTTLPFASDVGPVTLRLVAGSDDAVLASDSTKYLPDDFTLDVRDGLIFVNSQGIKQRIRRMNFADYLTLQLQNQTSPAQFPSVYCKAQEHIKFTPRVTNTITADLWYYKLPPALTARDKPKFPDAWPLIEYIRLRALEWAKYPGIQNGQAMTYIDKIVSGYQASGLFDEPEAEKIPLGNARYYDPLMNGNPWGWMGPF